MFSFYRQGDETQRGNSTYPKPDEASAFVLQARALCMLVFMRFGKHTGSWEKVPHKSKNTKWPFSKSFPFLRVLAPIQHDNSCSSCSSICATVNQINGGALWGPENETCLPCISRSLGSPLSISVISQVWELRGVLEVISTGQWLSNELFLVFVWFLFLFQANLMLQGIHLSKRDVLVEWVVQDLELSPTALPTHTPLLTSTPLLIPSPPHATLPTPPKLAWNPRSPWNSSEATGLF